MSSTTIRPLTEATLQLADGTRINYARSGDVSGVPVVFVHGWPDSWRSFQPVIEALPAALSSTSISLPGFGGSDAIASPARPSDLARAVIAFMSPRFSASLGISVEPAPTATDPARMKSPTVSTDTPPVGTICSIGSGARRLRIYAGPA